MKNSASLLILALNEAENLKQLLPACRKVLEETAEHHEIIVIDGGSSDATADVARANGARVLVQDKPGYGAGFIQGLRECAGEYLITLDADFSHRPQLIAELWSMRGRADIVVASRYVSGGKSSAPFWRTFSSWLLSQIFKRILSIPLHDLSSGFRLYRRGVLTPEAYKGRHFDILLEVLVRAVSDGRMVLETPLVYTARQSGMGHVRLAALANAYVAQLFRLWKLRNSIESVDYDHRAYDSRIPLQRYWQRKRFQIVRGFLESEYESVLDVGCGSSKIIQSLPQAVAFDLSKGKLRFLSGSNRRRVCGSTLFLPFRDKSFSAIVHSEVLEHVPWDDRIFAEISRVLVSGGRLVIGTPDYGRVWWPIIEYFYDKIVPRGYAEEHVTHYTREFLCSKLEENGFQIEQIAYICGGELIIKALKTGD